MKAQGIRFSVMTEEDAAKYLEINTYYFKIKVYAKLYEKYTDKADSDRYGKYIDLDFAYLRDLATIDSYLRKTILRLRCFGTLTGLMKMDMESSKTL